jgi:ribonuclease HI
VSGHIVAYIDGGSRGNPGPAGFGVRVEDENGRVLHELWEAVGIATNNVAEYRGLLAALGYLVRQDCRSVRIRSDSLLLVKQMRGEYKVKHPGLKPLHREASALAARLATVTFEHIPREANVEADRLANRAMDDAGFNASS